MTTAFRYRAATAGGDLVEGTLSAESERAALDEIRRRTLVPVSVEASAAKWSKRTWQRGADRADAVATAVRTLAALLGGGATIDRALEFAARQTGHPDVSHALDALRRDVQGGSPFAAALTAQTGVFGSLAPAMVRAGEESGSLDTALARLADHLERAYDLRSQLRNALMYPALLAVVAGVGVIVLLTFVVPRFVSMLAETGGQLPLSTRILVGVSHVLTSFWWLWTGVVVVGSSALLTWSRAPANRATWHGARLDWPIVGELERRIWAARFARGLAVLLQSGSRLLPSLRIARAGVENMALGSAIDAAIASVERGEGVARSFNGVFPPLATQLLAVGEESGTLDVMAARVADTYDGEVQRSLRSLVSLVEPVMIVLFGGLVGFVALAMLQAVYAINAGVL